jgi:gluconokinase
MVIVLIGVAGSGKTTVGQVLARRLGWPFRDGDDFHSLHAREKMRRGIPLDDEDRRPWLEAIRSSIGQALAHDENMVYACSALKKKYRDLLRVDDYRVKFVYLKGSPALIAERLANRRGHFFNPQLLQTQFKDLEEAKDCFEVDISSAPNAIADLIIDRLGVTPGTSRSNSGRFSDG